MNDDNRGWYRCKGVKSFQATFSITCMASPERPMRMQIPRHEGFALLIVLWAMIMLSLLVTHITSAGRGALEVALNLRRAAQLQAQTDGVVYDIIFGLLSNSSSKWPADGSVRRVVLPTAAGYVSVLNLGGRVNPNIAPVPLLRALMIYAGANAYVASEVSEAIAEWRSPPAGSAFRSIGEVGTVRGMTPTLLARLEPYLSLYNYNYPDMHVADPVVWRAMRSSVLATAVLTYGHPWPLREVEINVVMTGAGGATASRVADVQLRASSSSGAGFQVLSWQTCP